MDSEDFGPLTSAEVTPEGGTGTMETQVNNLQSQIHRMEQCNKTMEIEFSQKRAKFMEMFKLKEEELQQTRQLLAECQSQNEADKAVLKRLQQEVDDIKTVAAISEASKEDEVEQLRRTFQEESASLHHIMQEAVAQTQHTAAARLEEEKTLWSQQQGHLEKELQETRSKLSQEREGFLASVAKQLQKKVGAAGVGLSGQSQTEQETLEDSMRKAQEDAEILRSVVMPLEQEISGLKDRLRHANDTIVLMRSGKVEDGTYSTDNSFLDTTADLDEKVRELNQSLETEKSSRTDLEMYVAVLNTQKGVLQEECDKLRAQLLEVVQILEQERREHNDLKRTWNMANDQFLESQRLMMMDMTRMESVLTSEQTRQLAELKRKDADREVQEKRVKELEQMREKEAQDQERRKQEAQRAASVDLVDSSQGDTLRGSRTSVMSDEMARLEEESGGVGGGRPPREASHSPLLRRSQSNQSLQSITRELFDGGIHDTKSLSEESGAIRVSPDRAVHIPNLTEAQQRSITDPTPESEASQTLMASLRIKADSLLVPMVGKRLVSDKEWTMMQRDVQAAREKLGKPCDMCHNYESQLQTIQEGEKKAQAQLRTLERQLQAERQAMTNQQQYTEQLEASLKGDAERAEKQIAGLLGQMQDADTYLSGLKHQCIQAHSELQEQLKMLTADREETQRELTALQDENGSLLGKHSKHSQQMQEESINLPNNLEEMQLLLLRYREEIITAKAAREHVEGSLRCELLFLKDQVVAEQQEKATIEETLAHDITALQRQLSELQGVKQELEKQTTALHVAETKLRDAETMVKVTQDKSKVVIGSLQSQLDEHNSVKNKLRDEVTHLKVKVASLQIDLDNNEVVQRDFVKLSQSLQIQLEKIRSAEHEVRWQHDEDVEECSNCRHEFSVTKRKHHCKHCGRIFCIDCLSKTVHGGPNLRPSKVCDVCHTILVQDATPFFSTDVPHTPD